LREIEKGKTGPKQQLKDGADLQLTRTQAARDAELSERQQKTAMRLSNIPDDEFNEAVEGDNPPTVTVLAERATR
jgi:hypothetical protein